MLGRAIAKRLLDLDYNVIVYNRTRSKAPKLAKYGAKVKDSPKLVAKESELIITVVRDADAVNEICFGKDGVMDGISQGTIIADMSTIDPTESKKIAKKFAGEKDTNVGHTSNGRTRCSITRWINYDGSGK